VALEEWSDRAMIEREPWGEGGGTVSGASMRVALQELSYRKISKSLVKHGETAKGKSVSSKITCRE
jgi:hypothetical protein